MTTTHSIGTAGRLTILTRDELDALDAAALDVLADVGVSVPSARARVALVAQGATEDGVRLRLPRELVRRLVGLAPPTITLGARAGRPLVTGSRSLVTTDGCCVEIYDLETGEKRGTTAEDVATISRVVDAMPEVDFCWPAVSAQDRPVEVRGLHELYLAIANTGKHVQTVTVVEPELAEVAVRDGACRERLGREASRRAAHQRAARHGDAARQRRRHARGRPRLRRRRHPDRLRHHADGRVHDADHHGGFAGRGHRRGAGGRVRHPGRPSRRARLHLLHPERDGPEDGRLHGRRPGGHADGRRGRRRRSLLRPAHPVRRELRRAPRQPSWQSALDDTTTTYLSLAAGVDMLTGVGMVSGGRIFSYEEMALAVEALAQARAVAAGIDLSGIDGGPAGGVAAPAAGPSLVADVAVRGVGGGGQADAVAARTRPYRAPSSRDIAPQLWTPPSTPGCGVSRGWDEARGGRTFSCSRCKWHGLSFAERAV